MTRFRIFGLAGAAVLALALNGCGSSDERSDEPAAPPAAPMPTAVEMAASVLSMAKDTLADAMQSRMDLATGAPYDDWLAAQNAVLDAQNAVMTAAQAHLAALEADTATAFGDVDAARQAVANARAGVAATQMQIADNPRPVPPPPSGEIAGIEQMQTTGLLAALSGALADGATMKEHPMAAGTMWAPGGVRFTCAADAGDEGCVVGITVVRDSDGDITDVSATWTHGAVTAEFIDPLEDMNPAGAASVAAIMNNALGADAVADDTGTENVDETLPHGAYDDSTFGNLKDGGMIDGSPAGMGIGAASMDNVSVIGALDPNESTPSTVTAEITDGKSDDIGTEMAGAVGLVGWKHRVLHSDWGDTRTPDRDGGFETLAVVYSNIEAPADVAFEDVRNAIAMDMLTFDADAGPVDPKPWFTLREGLVENIDTTSPNWLVPAQTIVITVEDSLVADITQVKTRDEQVKGTYFGASGTFTCINTCTIRRPATGGTNFTVADLNGEDIAGFGDAGTWSFKPDVGAMVELPDQDWLAFGFWLTAPDDRANGLHRIGVVYDGMDTYGYRAATTATVPLDGTATYEGSAAGYYVNGTESGVFTASASLKADFVADMLEGRIDNFKDSRGAFIGSDTRADPNDPMHGGESDWVVRLRKTLINDTGGFDNASMTSGSADGVLWDGEWNAQLYGGGDRFAMPADEDTTPPTPATPFAPPSGVAGDFRAVSDALTTGGYKGVVGAFGAEMDTHTPTPPDEQ